MNRNRMGAIVIVLLIGVIVYMYLPSTMEKTVETDYGTDDAQSSYTVAVQFYDTDGNLVDVPMMQSSFKIGEVEVAEILVTLTWSSVGVNINWATFTLEGYITWFAVDYYGGQYLEANNDYTDTRPDGDITVRYVLGTDLCLPGHQVGGPAGDEHWYMRLDIVGDAVVYDVDSNYLSDSLPELTGTVHVYPYEPSSFEITGSFDW